MDYQQKIHILYALSDKKGTYAKFLGASMLSVMEHTKSPVVFHLFHDGPLTAENQKRLRQMVRAHGQKLRLYNVREQQAGVLRQAEEIFHEAMRDARYTEATFYRLLAPQALPAEVHRLIYLDAATVVHMDIQKLWREQIGASGMAAVRERTLLTHYHAKGSKEPKEEVYNRMTEAGVSLANCFNAGVLLMDLDRLRERGDILLPGLRFLAQYPGESKFFDQDILNYYFAKELTPLPWNYNILLHWDKQFGAPVLTEGIYHFMGHSLEMKESDPRDTLFFDASVVRRQLPRAFRHDDGADLRADGRAVDGAGAEALSGDAHAPSGARGDGGDAALAPAPLPQSARDPSAGGGKGRRGKAHAGGGAGLLQEGRNSLCPVRQ